MIKHGKGGKMARAGRRAKDHLEVELKFEVHAADLRAEERRVGKEGRKRGWGRHE